MVVFRVSGPQQLNIPNLITLGRVILVPVVFWLLGFGADAARVLGLRAGRRLRRRGRLHRQAVRTLDRTRRLSRSAGRQAVDRFDLRRAGRAGRAAVVARDRRRLARYPDRRRRHALVAARQAGAHQLRWPSAKPIRWRRSCWPASCSADDGFGLGLETLRIGLVWVAGVLTIASLAAYLRAWLRHMSG